MCHRVEELRSGHFVSSNGNGCSVTLEFEEGCVEKLEWFESTIIPVCQTDKRIDPNCILQESWVASGTKAGGQRSYLAHRPFNNVTCIKCLMGARVGLVWA
jgi:hypothetical protein